MSAAFVAIAGMALFVGARRCVAPPRLSAGACPLCGAPMATSLGLWDQPPPRDRCRLGTCVAAPEPGSIEDRLIEANRAVLADELLEVEFSFAALAAATALAKVRGRTQAASAYVDAGFPLAMRRRILRGYVEGGLR